MRWWLLLITAAACAQDNRGFVNQRLVTQNFVENSLKPKTVVLPLRKTPPAEAVCAIPLLRAQPSKATDSMVIPPAKDSGDEKMILPTIPVCPAK